jgi:site-specific recombinase XerD
MNNREKMREILIQLPELCYDFISSVSQRTSELTRLNYVHDLKLFFNFLHEFIPGFEKSPKDYTVSELKLVKPRNIDMFLEHVSSYSVKIDDKTLERTNHNAGKKRKITTIRAFYRFLYKRQLIDSDVTALVDVPKIKEKAIITLEPEEIQRLLATVENGNNLVGNGKAWNEKTRKRDLAIFALLLGTGIRISECVGLNIEDIDFDTGMFKVTRKGGNEAILYFSQEVGTYLLAYLKERKELSPNEGHEKALFLSSQLNRISVRAVQHFVANYKKAAGIVKKISPHKFRSTYGTRLYQSTQDIYLVADVLGHKDVNTTTKHYAKMSDELRKKAADKVSLSNIDDDNADD